MLKTMWKEWKVSAFHHNIWVYFPLFVPQHLRGKPNPRIPARVCRVFHIFPTPYYDYYNKFNKENRFLHRIP